MQYLISHLGRAADHVVAKGQKALIKAVLRIEANACAYGCVAPCIVSFAAGTAGVVVDQLQIKQQRDRQQRVSMPKRVLCSALSAATPVYSPASALAYTITRSDPVFLSP